MSLVSTVNDQERDDILYSTKVTTVKSTVKKSSSRGHGPSVYQTSGEPLSKEALYRAKLKYGVYQSPATQISTGVSEPKVASDIAANLANDNKTTIEAYKRMFVDPNAAKAATKVGVKGIESVRSVDVATSHAGSQSAATRAYSLASNEGTAKKVTKSSSSTTASRSKSHSISSATHAYSASSSFTSEQKVNPKPKPMNFSKVLAGAEKKAEQRIHDRTSPERKNFSYGLKTNSAGKAAGNSFQLTKETLDKISAKIDVSNIEKEADPNHYAEWAAYAVKDIDPGSLMDAEFKEQEKKRKEYLKQLTSQQVLTKARENADRELRAIDAADHHNFLFGNEAYNKAAVEVAQKNFQKKVPYQNKINMGGGLWLAPEDVDDIAKKLVSPLLNEVSERADDQRATDLDINERTEAYKTEYAAWLAMQSAKLHNDEAFVQNSERAQAKEKETAKSDAAKKLSDFIAKKDKEVEAKNEALLNAKESQKDLELENKQTLKADRRRIRSVLVSFDTNNNTDIGAARTEQEELLKPYHDDLKIAETEHDRLVQEKEDINKEIEKLRLTIEEHHVTISQYEKDIVAYEEQHQEELRKLENLGSDKAGLQTDLDDNVITLANKAKAQAALSSEEARLKQLEVEAMVNERRSQLNITQIELQRERLSMLDAMRELAESRGDVKIDDERVKKLIGMTSDEYVEQQKEVSDNAVKTPVSDDLDEEDEVDEDQNLSEEKQAPTNRHLEIAADEPGSLAAPSASAKSVKGASGVLVPEEETKATQTQTQTPGKAQKKHVAIAPPKTTPEAEKKEENPSWSEKFFLGSSRAKKRRESASKASVAKPKDAATTATAPAAKKSSTTAPATKKPATTTAAPAKEKNELEHTFSGFSQGSIPDEETGTATAVPKTDKKTKAPATEESEDDIPELSGPEENVEVNGDPAEKEKRSSYFKEVF